MATKLSIARKTLNKLNFERKAWLGLSALVVILSLILVLEWNNIQLHHTQWVFVTSGVGVSIVWWYWTMRLIRIVLNQRLSEIEILEEIVVDIKTIKLDVSKLNK